MENTAFPESLKKFSFVHYRVTLVPEDVIVMPARNKGNVLRGAFGSSLRRLVCSFDDDRSCEACPLIERCAYPGVFSPVGLIGAKRTLNAPRGYVLKPPLSTATEYTAASPLVFDMLLVGDRREYLPHVLVSLRALAATGIGVNRGRFRLGDVVSLRGDAVETVYDASRGTVVGVGHPTSAADLMEGLDRPGKERVTLVFLTPTRLKYNPTGERGRSAIVRKPEFHHVIRRLRDRVSALSRAYCAGPLDMDFRGLAERATGVRTVGSELRWVETARRSRTQRTRHDQSGFVGSVTFEGGLDEFLPFLLLGERLHVGEDATFGNGWYRVEGLA
ncbi:MAG TPA: CRISPR system precrRNA processing endoribonuclease RAMP protein Cas6 [Deltaproteobacteria bacterium]|nr:CRISPR system precrRNA processing endoribonuclease RAMP protein Cas6 [Deltaproteobacteria bacterium]